MATAIVSAQLRKMCRTSNVKWFWPQPCFHWENIKSISGHHQIRLV